MREIISLHIGQTGIKLGESCYELFNFEHEIDPNGFPKAGLKKSELDENVYKMYAETPSGKFVPRSLFMDFDNSALDSVKTGFNKLMYQDSQFLYGKQNTKSNYFVAKYECEKIFIEECMERIRKLSESCVGLEGFMIYNSVSGGIGSGFGTLIREYLHDEYIAKSKVSIAIYPEIDTKKENYELEKLNTICGTVDLMENSDLDFVFDNEAIKDILKDNFYQEQINLLNMNRLIAQPISVITGAIRFSGYANLSLNAFARNLVDFRNLQFIVPSYAPVIPAQKILYDYISTFEMTKEAFTKQAEFVKCDPNSKYIACNLLYRGDVVPKDINYSIKYLNEKSNLSFVNGSKPIFHVDVNYNYMGKVPKSDVWAYIKALCLLSNKTGIHALFRRFALDTHDNNAPKFSCYDNMEKIELCENYENFLYLINEYSNL